MWRDVPCELCIANQVLNPYLSKGDFTSTDLDGTWSECASKNWVKRSNHRKACYCLEAIFYDSMILMKLGRIFLLTLLRP